MSAPPAPDASARLVAVHGDVDDLAVAFRPAEDLPGAGELVVILQGREAWRALLDRGRRDAAAMGLDAWRRHTAEEDARLTREAPDGAPFDLGRALAGFPGLVATRRGAWFMVEGPGASAGIGLVACVTAFRGAVATLSAA